MSSQPSTRWSREQPAPGLVVYQPRKGFRYSMEPYLLGGWALERHAGRRFLDVGTGSGVLALLLARLGMQGEGIDAQARWVESARRSATESGLGVSFTVQDVRRPGPPVAALALCNPPFFPATSGPMPADPLRAASRFELAGTLAQLIEGMSRRAPVVALVLRPERADEAARLLAAVGRPVSARCEVGGRFTLIEGGGERGSVTERVPLEGARVRGWYERLRAPCPPPLGG